DETGVADVAARPTTLGGGVVSEVAQYPVPAAAGLLHVRPHVAVLPPARTRGVPHRRPAEPGGAAVERCEHTTREPLGRRGQWIDDTGAGEMADHRAQLLLV